MPTFNIRGQSADSICSRSRMHLYPWSKSEDWERWQGAVSQLGLELQTWQTSALRTAWRCISAAFCFTSLTLQMRLAAAAHSVFQTNLWHLQRRGALGRSATSTSARRRAHTQGACAVNQNWRKWSKSQQMVPGSGYPESFRSARAGVQKLLQL